MEADGEEIAEQVGVDVPGAPAHAILLEATDSLADGSFDFSLGSHGNGLQPIEGVSINRCCLLSSVPYNKYQPDD